MMPTRRSRVKRFRSALRMRDKIRRADAGAGIGSTHRQTIVVELLDDLGRQQGHELLHLGVVLAEVAADIAAATTSSGSDFIATTASTVSPVPRPDRTAMVSAVRQIARAPSRKASKSLRAALTQEIGLVDSTASLEAPPSLQRPPTTQSAARRRRFDTTTVRPAR